LPAVKARRACRNWRRQGHGFTNLPARLASDASSLYAKNFLALLPLLTDKDSKAFAPAWDDEIIKGAMLSRGGALVHPHFASASAA